MLKNTVLISMISVAAAVQVNAASYCPAQAPAQSLQWAEAQKTVEEKIQVFANSKDVATLGDAMLSQLLSAKSPLITSWMKTRQLNDKSEDQIVRAWREYFARQFVLSTYPHKDAKLNSAIEKLVDGINDKVMTTDFKGKMEKIFLEAQTLAVQKIKAWALTEESRAALTKKIEAARLHWFKKFSDSHFKNAPLEYLSWGVAYDPKNNSLNMGVESLGYSADDTVLAVFAHELGHAVDSCRWGQDQKTAWPFAKVGECLRSKKSVGAKKRDDSRMAALVKSGQLDKDSEAFLKAHGTCNRSNYPPLGVQADQLPETFADWFAAEVVSQKDAIGLHLRADLCEARKLNAGSSYVSNQDRLEKIYFSQPQLRKKAALGEKGAPSYCAF